MLKGRCLKCGLPSDSPKLLWKVGSRKPRDGTDFKQDARKHGGYKPFHVRRAFLKEILKARYPEKLPGSSSANHGHLYPSARYSGDRGFQVFFVVIHLMSSCMVLRSCFSRLVYSESDFLYVCAIGLPWCSHYLKHHVTSCRMSCQVYFISFSIVSRHIALFPPLRRQCTSRASLVFVVFCAMIRVRLGAKSSSELTSNFLKRQQISRQVLPLYEVSTQRVFATSSSETLTYQRTILVCLSVFMFCGVSSKVFGTCFATMWAWWRWKTFSCV